MAEPTKNWRVTVGNRTVTIKARSEGLARALGADRFGAQRRDVYVRESTGRSAAGPSSASMSGS